MDYHRAKRVASLLVVLGACEPHAQPSKTTDSQSFPGLGDGPRMTGGKDSNTPLRPLEGSQRSSATHVAGVPQTCWTDADCTSAFSHCVQDVPSEVGLCTRECTAHSDCTSNAMWSCQEGLWTPSTGETKQMCVLTCALNADCPTGTSCNGGYCGTPCSGGNCQAESCTSNYALECVGDAVYWFNSCGDIEGVKEVCAAGDACVFGQCIPAGGNGSGGNTGGSGSTGSSSCGGTVYRCGSSSTVLEVDSCNNVKGSYTCSGGKQCSAGTCVCGPSSQTKCLSGKLWRLDSCGNPKSIVGKC